MKKIMILSLIFAAAAFPLAPVMAQEAADGLKYFSDDYDEYTDTETADSLDLGLGPDESFQSVLGLPEDETGEDTEAELNAEEALDPLARDAYYAE
jgi:hypothetical protein